MLETFGFTNFVEICLINAMSPFDACDHLCSWEWVCTESRQGVEEQSWRLSTSWEANRMMITNEWNDDDGTKRRSGGCGRKQPEERDENWICKLCTICTSSCCLPGLAWIWIVSLNVIKIISNNRPVCLFTQSLARFNLMSLQLNLI